MVLLVSGVGAVAVCVLCGSMEVVRGVRSLFDVVWWCELVDMDFCCCCAKGGSSVLVVC